MEDNKTLVYNLRKKAHGLPDKFTTNAETIDLLMKAADVIESYKMEKKPKEEKEEIIPCKGCKYSYFPNNKPAQEQELYCYFLGVSIKKDSERGCSFGKRRTRNKIIDFLTLRNMFRYPYDEKE